MALPSQLMNPIRVQLQRVEMLQILESVGLDLADSVEAQIPETKQQRFHLKHWEISTFSIIKKERKKKKIGKLSRNLINQINKYG